MTEREHRLSARKASKCIQRVFKYTCASSTTSWIKALGTGASTFSWPLLIGPLLTIHRPIKPLSCTLTVGWPSPLRWPSKVNTYPLPSRSSFLLFYLHCNRPSVLPPIHFLSSSPSSFFSLAPLLSSPLRRLKRCPEETGEIRLSAWETGLITFIFSRCKEYSQNSRWYQSVPRTIWIYLDELKPHVWWGAKAKYELRFNNGSLG